MKNSKLLLLLQSLDEAELARFENFLLSPYFNQDEKLIGLFRKLKAYYPTFTNPGLSKEQLFRELFPGASYQDKQVRYLMSRLNKLGEKFLSIEQSEREPYQMGLSLLEALSEKGLEKSYQSVQRAIEEEWESPKGDSTKFFLSHLHWAEIKERHFERQRLRRYDENIQLASGLLDRYYFLHRLKFSCAMLDRQTIFQESYQLNLSPSWVIHLEQQEFFEEPIIQLYYTIFQALLEEEREAHFSTLKRFMDKEAHKIPFRDLKDIYLFAINYCARKIRKGKEPYVEEALGLYRSGIESGLLIEKGFLSPWAFTNVVKLSLRLKRYTWIESFIQDYAPRLPEAFRENALHYNLAELYYSTGRFALAQEHLNQVAFSDLNYYLGARVLLAKIFYEQEEEEPLLSLIASFTIFLKRNKQLSSDLKETYLNFCQILFQLVRSSPCRMKRIGEKIERTRLLTDRAWLKDICQKKKG